MILINTHLDILGIEELNFRFRFGDIVSNVLLLVRLFVGRVWAPFTILSLATLWKLGMLMSCPNSRSSLGQIPKGKHLVAIVWPHHVSSWLANHRWLRAAFKHGNSGLVSSSFGDETKNFSRRLILNKYQDWSQDIECHEDGKHGESNPEANAIAPIIVRIFGVKSVHIDSITFTALLLILLTWRPDLTCTLTLTLAKTWLACGTRETSACWCLGPWTPASLLA